MSQVHCARYKTMGSVLSIVHSNLPCPNELGELLDYLEELWLIAASPFSHVEATHLPTNLESLIH